MKKLISNDVALTFMLAGKCEVTILSSKTGAKFTYSIKRKESRYDETKYIYFISVVNGKDYIYAGLMTYDEKIDAFVYRQGAKGQFSHDTKVIKSLLYVINKLYKEEYSIAVEIYHCGKCGRCGRKLITPESILTGLGPECAKISGITYVKLKNRKADTCNV